MTRSTKIQPRDLSMELAREISLAATANDIKRLSDALNRSEDFLRSIRTEEVNPDSPSYAQGMHDACLDLIESVRLQAIPEKVMTLGRTYARILAYICAKPGITGREISGLTGKYSDEETSNILGLLYSARLIEPAFHSDGVHLTYSGTRTLMLIAPQLLGEMVQVSSVESIPITPQPSTLVANELQLRSVSKLHQMLKHSEGLERATRSLLELDRVAADLCTAIDATCGFDFTAVQLIRFEENAIETIAGSGIAKAWAGHVKHRMALEPELRDIQADIAAECKVEVISGDDPRLDPFIKERYHHKFLSRVFVPIVIVHDRNGNRVEDERQWNIERKEDGGFLLKLDVLPDDQRLVIGTVEAGFKPPSQDAPPRRISHLTAQRLAEFVKTFSGSVYQCTLRGVLESVAEMARGLAAADIVSLQWGALGTDKAVRFWHTVYAGILTEKMRSKQPNIGTVGGSPRKDGMGASALSDGQPKFECDDLARTNRELHEQGVKALAVYPSAQAQMPGEKVCLIYAHYLQPKDMDDEELKWVHYLARRSGDLLRTAFELAQVRDRERALLAMQQVAVSFSQRSYHPSIVELVRFIAWSTLNLRGADVVSIYRYDSANARFMIPPEIAGRLHNAKRMSTELGPNDAPALVLEHRWPLFVSEVQGHAILDPYGRPDGFIVREKIVSSAAMLLEAEDECVGLMFVNYRVHHEFPFEEQQQLRALASISASALRNYSRTTRKLVDDDQIESLAAAVLN